jgi:hypothetical protein
MALTCPIDSDDPDGELERMCNRYQSGDRQRIVQLFAARKTRPFNAGPDTVHPKDPGWVVRLQDGDRVLEQMTRGFPVVLVRRKASRSSPSRSTVRDLTSSARSGGAGRTILAAMPDTCRALCKGCRRERADDRDVVIGERPSGCGRWKTRTRSSSGCWRMRCWTTRV